MLNTLRSRRARALRLAATVCGGLVQILAEDVNGAADRDHRWWRHERLLL
jgi:hypothetical protein